MVIGTARRKRRRTALALSGTVVAVAVCLATALPSGAATTASGIPLAATAGCGKSPTLTSGTHSISSNGTNRTFILRVPDNYDNSRPYRLVFAFHWWGGTATDVATGQGYYGLLRQANNSTIFVAPQGIDNAWPNSGDRDVAFVDSMVSLIQNALCVDTTQLFALGFSYGGGMSYALACARANVFRAVAIYSAGVISGCSGGNQPIAYFQAHGLSDNVLPISGARSMRDRFVRNNGCTPQNPPEPAPGSGTHITTAYAGCSAGYPVVWAAFDGGHTPTPTDAGNRTWLPEETWRFFTQFSGAAPSSPTTVTSSPTSGPSSPTGSASCSATYTITGQWSGGFQAEVRVTAGSAPIRGWTVTWSLANGQQVSQAWNATVTTSGSTATARNVSYNGALAATASTTFGFLGSWNGSNPVPALTCTAA